jgi:hypothetical protein
VFINNMLTCCCMIIMLWKIKPPQCIITKQEYHNGQHKDQFGTHMSLILHDIYFFSWTDWWPLWSNISWSPWKHIIAYLNPCKVLSSQKTIRMFSFFYFHILIIAKFGYIGLWMIATSGTITKSMQKKH